MTYIKTRWINRVKDEQGQIVQEGTPVDQEHLNHMETGIEEAHTDLNNKMPKLASGTYSIGNMAVIANGGIVQDSGLKFRIDSNGILTIEYDTEKDLEAL